MLDTDLHGKQGHGDSTDPLDVDRFFHAVVVEPTTPPTWEATVVAGREEGEVHLVGIKTHVAETSPKGDYLYLRMKTSRDGGRTWGDFCELKDRAGGPVHGFHQSVFRMQSGRLGVVYNDTRLFPGGTPGRDLESGMMFRSSNDEGRTWSDPVVVYPYHAMCCSGRVVVLDSGRILAPAYTWLSHLITVESEARDNFSYSFVLISDDEGMTWRKSYSEVFLRRGLVAYHMGEPTVVALKGGRLLMDLRSDLGRRYFSYSEDDGVSWTKPAGMPIASGCTPAIIRRMPTGELLMIWNQVSRMESLRGHHRHRLSCAVSGDEGQTWENFKNLESLDNETVIPPPPADRYEAVDPTEDYAYLQPSDTDRYVRSPGVLRVCYPDVAFIGDEAVIVYDYGFGTVGDHVAGTKLRVIPLDYLSS